jgi:hypothetical protein
MPMTDQERTQIFHKEIGRSGGENFGGSSRALSGVTCFGTAHCLPIRKPKNLPISRSLCEEDLGTHGC